MGQESVSKTAANDPALLNSLHKWTVIVCIGAGVMGMLSAYAIFLLWQQKIEEVQELSHVKDKQQAADSIKQIERNEIKLFLMTLTCAALAAFVIEYMRDIIKHGHPESLAVGRILTTVITLMMFELFTLAWEETPRDRPLLSQIPLWILGDSLNGIVSPWWDIVGMCLLWVCLGAFLSLTLGRAILKMDDSPRLPLRLVDGAKSGIFAGALSAPIGAVALVLLLRMVVAIYTMFAHHLQWSQRLDHLASMEGVPGPVRICFYIFGALDHLFTKGWWGALLGVIIVIFILGALSIKDNPYGLFAVIAIVVIFFGPILTDTALLKIPFLALVAWLLPGCLLGAMIPFLQQSEARSTVWGGIALIATAILTALTWSRFEFWWVLPLLMLLITAMFLFRSAPVEDYWPIVAVSLGVIVFGVCKLQQASFGSVLKNVRHMTNLQFEQPVDDFPQIDTNYYHLNQFNSLSLQRSLNLYDQLRSTSTMPTTQSVLGESILTTESKSADTPDASDASKSASAPAPTSAPAMIEDDGVLLRLELAIAGSLGFWTTVAMLATWALKDRYQRLLKMSA